MKMKLTTKKSSAYVYIVFLVLMIFITLVYLFFSQVLSLIEPQIKDYINTTVNTSAYGIGISSSAMATFDIVDTVWKYWPIFLIFGLLLWVYASATKREDVAM